MNVSDLQLQLQCPQCGAQTILNETDRVFSCLYCRVRLYMPAKIPFQCYIPPRTRTPEDGNFLYLPYWRFRGVSYALNGFQVLHRIVDTSVAGVPLKGIPYSLGVRPQTLKLHFLTPGTPGQFIKPSLGLEAFLQRIGQGFPANPAGKQQTLQAQAFIGETASLIYTPFRLSTEGIWDALTEKPLPLDELSRESLRSLQDVSKDSLQFWATLCPECGRDLEAHRDSAVLFCTSCHCGWEAGKGGYEKVHTGIVECECTAQLWLPFWRLETNLTGVPLRTLADFIHLTGLARVPLPGMETTPFFFWIPGFKVNPHLFLRVSRQMTIAQRLMQEHAWPDQGERHPCCLPAGEALQSVPIVLADLSLAREAVFPLMKHAMPVLKDRRLVFVPFLRKGLEIIQPELGFSIPKAALQFGRSL